MKRAPSALRAIGGFGVAVATLSVATTAAIVLLTPQPPALRTSATAAVAALRGDVQGFDRRYLPTPPQGRRVSMLEQMLVAELRRPPADVQVTWLDSAWQDMRDQARHGVALPDDASKRIPNGFVLVGGKKGRFEMLAPSATTGSTRDLLFSVPMPAFIASVRQEDGRWLTVRPVQPFMSGWRLKILIALAVSLFLLAPFAWMFARRLTRPFRALARALEDGGDAVPEAGPRELREAAAAIAAMRTKLAAEATERARMLTAIAHDLRTPLTGLRLRIEAAPEPQRARMVADIDRMQAMIGEVLGFARDAAAPRERLDVRALLAEIVADTQTNDGAVRLAPGDDARIEVPVPAFRRVIENLVRNAIDYAGGGTIELRHAQDDVFVSIVDAGPGISATDRQRLLQPFERGDTSRNRDTGGTGLGLSIVHDFAVQHRGDFTLADADGGGTIATLRLPSA